MEYLIVIIAVIAFNVFAASAKKRGGSDGGVGGGADMSGRSDSADSSGGDGFGDEFDSDSDADSGGLGDEGYYSEAEMSRGDMENSGEDFDGAREFVERLKRERAASVGGGMSAGGGAANGESFDGNLKPFMYGGTLREVPEERVGEASAGADLREEVGGGVDMSGRSDSAGESRFDAELRMLRERSESLQNTLRSIRDFEEQNKIARGRGGAEGSYFAEIGSESRGADGSQSEESGGLQSSGYWGGFFASKDDLRRAVLASEILGKPVSLGK